MASPTSLSTLPTSGTPPPPPSNTSRPSSSNRVRTPSELALIDIGSGTCGGMAQVVVGHPLDTIKTRLQVQTDGKYKGLVDCYRQTVAEEGVRGLYKGALSPLAGAMAHNAGLFFVYGQTRAYFAGGDELSSLSPSRLFLAGGSAAAVISLVETPIDLFKIQVQRPGATLGVVGAFRAIAGARGVRGVYQGIVPTTLRNVPAFGSYFAAFELVKRALTPADGVSSLPACFVAGGAAGFAFWGPWYPLEVIKSRIQADANEPSARRYAGVVDCVRQTAAEGVGAFFKGYTPAVMRAVFVNAAVFTAVTAVKQRMLAQP